MQHSKNCSDFKNYHVLTCIFVFLSIIIILFSNENPVILGSVYIFIISMIMLSKEKEKFKKGFLYFIPVALLIIIINIFFVSEGTITLFYLFNKRFTLESIIYAVIMAFKYLAVVYTFMVLDLMIDSDKAVSYFSSIMPKSTLMMMISIKLIPNMKNRFKNLKEIYAVRGVVFDKKKTKERTRSYVPMMSILLEDSMEGSFAIGEAAYVRGFLSGKRSVYERQKFKSGDFKVISINILLIICYLIAILKKYIRFNIYENMAFKNYFNIGTIGILLLIVLLTLTVSMERVEK